MSFSKQVKNELLKTEYEKACCEKAMLYGMCLFGKSFSPFGVSLQSESEETARLYKRLLAAYCGVKCRVITSAKGRSFSITVSDSTECEKILRAFGHDGRGSIIINFSNFVCDACVSAFLAGAFLSCGTVSDPNKDYHLEFTVPYRNLSKSLATLLEENELSPKTSVRKGYNIIYFKGSEAIEDCLYIMGASASMFEMMNVEIIKDFRNKANRTANCETANIEKTVRASCGQLTAIEKIKEKKGLGYLKQDLRDIAELRLENPEASLADLAQLCGMSRSGVNHRLKRIVEIAQDLDAQQKLRK